ncbi:serine hydrolase [Porphyrobacter sp. GA68]|uniref:serine hydrolase domain-containing protein n=1 Tax=Porphyrobacter sp. GA68 TaxID=2883480 RepID=UPI001D18235C|nr:serine hydrolase [Porphyrobacter sp. GA68]
MLASLAGETAAQDRDLNFDRRWQSLAAGGYDPLTIPVDWYDHVARVPGAERPFEVSSPTDAGIAPSALAAAAAWAKGQNSTALIIARSGRIVFEEYWQGTGRDTRFNPQSMAKTVTALLIGTAVERGEIGSVSDPVERYLPEWRGQPRGRITLEHMLWMAAGLEQGDGGMGYAVSPDNPLVRHSLGSDYTRLPLSLRAVARPGIEFDYNNQVNQLLGIVLERATGARYETLVSKRLWEPLGLRDAAMPLDRDGGMVMTSCCILSRPVDWLRIGQLFAGRGMVDGRQVVPAAWIDRMTAPSPAYPGYGYQIWIGDQLVGGEPQPRPGIVPWQGERFAAPRMVMLNGHGGQRVYVLPDKQLVIVRTARDWPDAWDDAVLPNVIWKGAE